MKHIFILSLSAGLIFSCAGNEDKTGEESTTEEAKVEETINGLSEDKRKEIFYAISDMEHNAQLEADKKYDMEVNVTEESMKNNTKENTRLKEEGQNVIMAKYQIDDKTYWDIAVEGVEKKW